MTEKITKTAVLARPGWSGTLVTQLLGEPDERKKVRGSTVPLALYELARVQLAEASQQFTDAQSGLAKRKAASQKAIATKITRLFAAIEAMPITVTTLTATQVVANAIRDYNSEQRDRAMRRGDYDWAGASLDSDPLFLERITVNYIRHKLSQYDRVLETTAGKTGVHTARVAINKRVYAVIAATYPQFADECARQLARKFGDPDLADAADRPELVVW